MLLIVLSLEKERGLDNVYFDTGVYALYYDRNEYADKIKMKYINTFPWLFKLGGQIKNSNIKQRQIKWITIKECSIESNIVYIMYTYYKKEKCLVLPFGLPSMKDDPINKKLTAKSRMSKFNPKRVDNIEMCLYLILFQCKWISFVVYIHALSRAINNSWWLRHS